LCDGHVGINAADLAAQQTMTEVQRKIAGGGFGLIATRLDDGGVIVSWVKPGGPAARAGMRLGARLLTWGSAPVAKALARTSTVLGPSQPTFARTRYEPVRFLVRAPGGEGYGRVWGERGEPMSPTNAVYGKPDAGRR
jgi:membrane-associated protease RseP (regulator of RpoE activity)